MTQSKQPKWVLPLACSSMLFATFGPLFGPWGPLFSIGYASLVLFIVFYERKLRTGSWGL